MVKNLFVIGVLLLILLQACSKSHLPQPGLMGQWRLMKVVTTIGITPTIIDYSNETQVLQLQPDSSYKKMNAGTLTESGVYHIAVYPTGSVPDTAISFHPGGSSSYDSYTRVLHLDGLQLYLKGVDTYQLYQKQ